MKLNCRNQVKILLAYEGLKLRELVDLINENSEKKYTPDGLSHKLRRGRLTYEEMILITDLLGYEINIVKKQDEK